jgi:hypothetical protein
VSTIYYVNGTTGWGTTFDGIPTAPCAECGDSLPLIITWPNPAPIVYGTTLSSSQLDATANVPGSCAYNPTYGTVLNVGTNTLSVIFRPSDTVDYTSVTDTVTLSVVVGSPPIITAGPWNQTVVQGSDALLSVTAGGASPLSYQWQFNGTNLPGANSTNLSISNVQLTNTGSYSVIVSNLCGSVTSADATLIVCPNLVSNGGFEAGDFTSWTLSGDTSWTSVDNGSQSGIMPHSGNYEATLGTTSSLGYLSQTLSTTAGGIYLLSFWLNNVYNDPNGFIVSWNGNTLLDATNLTANNWTNMQFVAKASGTSAVLQFGFEDVYNWLGLDDICVGALPPAALPGIAGISLSGTNLVINGCNGFPGMTCYVLMSTNLALPLNQWTPVATNALNASGNFSITATNAVNLNLPQCFYILQMQ